MTGFWYIFGGSFLLIIIFTAMYNALYQSRLRRHRGLSREEFIETFHDLGIPETIPGAVYDRYKSFAIWKDFSVSPSDRYKEVFRERPEDIGEDAEELINQ